MLRAACLFAPLALPLALPVLADAQTGLTIYNQNFAVVRDTLKMDMKPGVNDIACMDITAHVESASVILRDPTGGRVLRVLEQNYRADPLSQDLLLSLYEGKTINFLVTRGDKTVTVPGKVVRSGYVPHYSAFATYGSQYAQGQYAFGGFGGYGSGGGQPIIEMEGAMRFGLPGQPLFPTLAGDTILKPTLNWKLTSDKPGPLNAELSYITGGMRWQADYNFVAPVDGDTVDMVGWVTMDNQSGKTFDNAHIKLMAGDVSKIQNNGQYASPMMAFGGGGGGSGEAAVTEKPFDEYHLYTLALPTTLHDRETKQVEFARANGIHAQRVYVYNGADMGSSRYQGYSQESLRQTQDYGTQSNPKVWVMREFRNTRENSLGIPLPKGRVRFYRQDGKGAENTALEFTGENIIDHTPQGELLRVYTGDAFDLTGERRQTDFRRPNSNTAIETFEIKVRNHKAQAVEVRVPERLYRWLNWQITSKSDDYTKVDSQRVEFRLSVPAGGERVLTYTVQYSW